MRYILLATFILFTGFAVNAQDCPHPSGCVTISREAALKAIADDTKVKALETLEIVKDKAIDDITKELNRIRIEFAEKSGENTALKQNAISDRAIMEILVKNSRKRCSPLSICF